MDHIDHTLLERLQKNSRESFADMAKAVGLTAPATRRRIERLEAAGTIRRFTIERGEMGTSAIVLVSVDSSHETSDVSESLAGLDGIRTIYEITGQYDIVAILSAAGITELNTAIDSLRRTAGIIDTNTVIILRRVS